VNIVKIIRFPQNVRKFSSSCTPGGFSSSDQLHVVGWSWDNLLLSTLLAARSCEII
jgi:hypothetical protein